MRIKAKLDWSYLLLCPFVALINIPIMAVYFKMRYAFVLLVVWVFFAIFKRRQVHLPQRGRNNLIAATALLCLYTCLGSIYGFFGIGANLTPYYVVAGLIQVLIPLTVFHLSICNGRQRELQLLVLYCFFCIAVGAVMTYFGEVEVEGGSRAIAGSTDDAQYAVSVGIGSYGFVYGIGLLAIPLLHGMTFMRVQQKVIFGALITVILLAVYAASYTFLLIAMALAGALYLAARADLKRRTMNLMGIILIVSLVTAVAAPKTLSFMGEPILALSDLTGNKLYKSRMVSVAEAMSGDVGTYADERSSLYWDSLRVFLKYPMFGGGSGENRRPAPDVVGGHSVIFDTLGSYGLFGFTIYVLFFVCHYRYLRVMSAVAIGDKWRSVYSIFMFSTVAVMIINPLRGALLFFNLCLYIPSLSLFFKKNH